MQEAAGSRYSPRVRGMDAAPSPARRARSPAGAGRSPIPWKNRLVRAVVSRVSTAAVIVDGETVGEIGRGVLALVGVGRADDGAAAAAMARKIHELRIFPSEDGAVSASDLGLPVLVVS